MPAWSDPFLAGPLGAVDVALPSASHAGGVKADRVRSAAVQTSLTGAMVRDTFAVRRSYAWTWPRVTPDQLDRLRRLTQHRRVCRLIDPWERNRLHTDVAGAGSDTGAPSRFTATAGATLAWRELVTGPAGVGAVGGLVVTIPAGIVDVAITLAAVAGRTAFQDPGPLAAPVLPAETVTASVWARGPANTFGVAVASRWFDSRVTPDASPAFTSGPAYVALSPTVWTRHTVTVPPVGPCVAITPGFYVSASGQATAPTVVEMTGLQVEAGPTATAWSPGGGAPAVLFDLAGDNYRPHNRHELTLTAQEA